LELIQIPYSCLEKIWKNKGHRETPKTDKIAAAVIEVFNNNSFFKTLPSVLGHYWFGSRKGIFFVCLVFNGIFSTNRLYHAIGVGKYIT